MVVRRTIQRLLPQTKSGKQKSGCRIKKGGQNLAKITADEMIGGFGNVTGTLTAIYTFHFHFESHLLRY